MDDAMETRKDEVLGVILAGGRSRRFGHDKAVVEVDGEALVVRTARVVGAVLDVVVVGDEGLRALWPEPPTWVADLERYGGPLGGVVSAWRAYRRPLVVVACDLPCVSEEVVRRLAAPLPSGAAARVPQVSQDTSVRQWLCAHYGVTALATMEGAWLAGERSMRRSCERLVLDDGGPWDTTALSDADTPEALAALIGARPNRG